MCGALNHANGCFNPTTQNHHPSLVAAALAGCIFTVANMIMGGNDTPSSASPPPPPPAVLPPTLWEVADPIPLLPAPGGDASTSLYLGEWRGSPVLIANTASLCGYTSANYKGLSQMHTTYAPRGLHVLGFPCAQFGGQEHADARVTRAAADPKRV